MRSRKHKIEKMFSHFAADLSRVRPELDNMVACPLCLCEFGPDKVNLLSVEHAVPSALGGTIETLTCTQCNNRHGSALDTHLVGAMKALDRLEGRAPIESTMNRDGEISMDLYLLRGVNDRPMIKMEIVEKASKKSALEKLRINPPEDGDRLTLHFPFGFVPQRYWKAALRSAYLSVFDVEGNAYLYSEGAAQVRRILDGQEPVESGLVTEAFPDVNPPKGALVISVRLNDIGDHYAVLLRMRSARIRYLCVFLPGKYGNDWSSFGSISENASRLRIETTPIGSHSKLFINLNIDPITNINPITAFRQ